MAMTVLPSDENNYLPALSGGEENIILEEILHCHQGYVGSASLNAYIDHAKNKIVITLYIQLLDQTPYHHVMEVSMESSISVYEISNTFCNIVKNIVAEHIKKKGVAQKLDFYKYAPSTELFIDTDTVQIYKAPTYKEFVESSYNVNPYIVEGGVTLLGKPFFEKDNTVGTFIEPMKKLFGQKEKSIIEVFTACPRCSIVAQSVYTMIMHLNDDHKIAREEIADWLDELHDSGVVDLTIEIPDSEDKL